MPTPKPTPKPKPKVKGAIIQGSASRKAYSEGRKTELKTGMTGKQAKANAGTYTKATKALKNKSPLVIERPGFQNDRAYAAGRLAVNTARKTKKVSGPKSKRGN